jgi:urocanate hydratase
MIIKLPPELPPDPEFDVQYRRAPNRGFDLSENDTVIALKNALRYVSTELHEALAPEFLDELMTKGRIYGYRYRPQGAIKALPVDEYKGILEARALQLMIDNNLDFNVALYPYELVTYGESGQVCQNWNFLLISTLLAQSQQMGSWSECMILLTGFTKPRRWA